MNASMSFILVDDDEIHNTLHDIIIKSILGKEADIEIFTEPEKGLEFIQKKCAESSGHTILFLDVDMPGVDGWEFLVRYEEFTDEVKMKISIYILSISLDHRDRNRAGNNKNVRGFILKPLTTKVILSIAENRFEN